MKNNVITIILIVVIGLIGFAYLNQNKSANTSTTLSADVKTSDSVDATYIYKILQQMAQVNLDDSIFSNQNFQSLKDNTVSFSPQAAGRPNPFSPVGTDGSIGQTVVSTTSSVR